jgi:FKBP-type peptidyl-prolyl cis-trans isomerase 2
MIAKTGDMVSVHYTGRLNDGTQFDSSTGRAPLEFTLGSGMVIKGFDDGVTGMQIGDKKTVTIPAAEAYGEVNEEMFFNVPKTQFPADLNPQVGDELQMNDDQGHVFPVRVHEVQADAVIIDANHQLAGKELIFDLELVSVNAV